MLNASVLVAGVARNCADNLPKTLRRLEGLTSTFSKVEYVFVTNDSMDDTAEILKMWSKSNPRASVIELNGLAGNVPRRTPRIAISRNLYLQYMRDKISNGSKFDYLLVADLDGVNENLIDEPIFSSIILGAPKGWVGLFANQRQKYYDIWALRHPEWCPYDCWKEFRKQKGGLRLFRKKNMELAKIKYIYSKQIFIPPNQEPIPVVSAFGGLGIYRVSAIGSSYGDVPPDVEKGAAGVAG